MTDSTAARRARLEPLLESARGIANGSTERGRQARKRLAESCGLSAEGVDFALSRCLEIDPSEAELTALLDSTALTPSAHVLLSANVFVAAHRAIAIGLAASPHVYVRASRREPTMVEILLEGAPGSFQLRSELSPQPGDSLWAYGADETLRSVARTLPVGTRLHAHGSGFGVGVIIGQPSDFELARLLPQFAEDIALFDQRGCLSPRVLLATGGLDFARELSSELAKQLASLERRIPRGQIDAQEAADITVYRDTAGYLGETFTAGSGFVSMSPDFLVPPVGRHLHVHATSDPLLSLSPWSAQLTSCAVAGDPGFARQLERAFEGSRVCSFGQMQRPPFDGPVDRRTRDL